eukprot:NODE_2935_length_967_cov_70.463095_g2915_i0.p1 GENE.NODE_2935_length_967_cov_70.463095_g2915_i0~~NODE_2935_length_967_cov_70.463095_g2915_i0.p1  ORF type:complete len:253 (+),score=18.24 NODE_2935_length_967_cov_70.463095_g2915_i0:127-885(+)
MVRSGGASPSSHPSVQHAGPSRSVAEPGYGQQPNKRQTSPSPTQAEGEKKRWGFGKAPAPAFDLGCFPQVAPVLRPAAETPPLTKKVEVQMVSRLSRAAPTPEPTEIERPCSRLTKIQQAGAVARLYKEGVERKLTLGERLDKKWYGEPLQPSYITQDELADNIERLYVEQQQKSAQKKAELSSKYLCPLVRTTKHKSAETEASVVQRLFDTRQRDREAAALLDEKYLNPLGQTKKMSPGALKQAMARLSGT